MHGDPNDPTTMLQPEIPADLIVYLASDLSRAISGAIIPIDRAWSCTWTDLNRLELRGQKLSQSLVDVLVPNYVASQVGPRTRLLTPIVRQTYHLMNTIIVVSQTIDDVRNLFEQAHVPRKFKAKARMPDIEQHCTINTSTK
jgi:hypothetical protein